MRRAVIHATAARRHPKGRMTPYYEHGGVTLYKGDCRAGLREIAPASVALLLTDPPYGISVESDQFADAATDWDKGDQIP